MDCVSKPCPCPLEPTRCQAPGVAIRPALARETEATVPQQRLEGGRVAHQGLPPPLHRAHCIRRQKNVASSGRVCGHHSFSLAGNRPRAAVHG